MYKLIPVEERGKCKCCVCNTTKSVKYIIATNDGKELTYCNRCALIYFAVNKTK